jgi:hypothetical protein
MKGRAVAVAGRVCILSGSDTVPDVAFHLDVGGQVGVWHSDAVMQPGPRDGRGSTNGLGAPMGWLMIVLATVRSKVPNRMHILLLACHVGRLLAFDQSKGETRPDAGLHACQS